MSEQSEAARRPSLLQWSIGTVVVASMTLVAGFFAGKKSGAAHALPPVSCAPLLSTEDTNHDGKPDRWLTRDREGAHLLLSVELDRNGDGKADKREHYAGGLRIFRVDLDEDFDGRYDRYDTLTAQGYAILTHYDRDWNDSPERWVQRGGAGTIISEWTDQDENSAPERYREFDSTGRVTEEGIDLDGDGLYEIERFYNTHWPNPTQPETVERDDNRDGQFERREVFDSSGRLLIVMLDTNADGNRDVMRYLDPQGAVYKEGHDRDGNGDFEEWRFPQRTAGVRVGYDDDNDRDIDRWDRPGAPEGWCEARCRVR